MACGATTAWLDATRTGDRTHVEEACAAAIAYAKVSKTGVFAKTMGTYAQGLLHAAKQEHGKACPLLKKAVDVMCKEGWAMPAVLAATEAASAYAAAGQTELAKAVLAEGGKALNASGDRAVAQMWRAAVSKTLAGADASVVEAANSAITPHMGAAPPSRRRTRRPGRPRRRPGQPGGAREVQGRRSLEEALEEEAVRHGQAHDGPATRSGRASTSASRPHRVSSTA